MEIKILENKKNRIVLEARGADHGFCNILIKELWKDKNTKSAGYHVDHPLVGIPKIIVESKKDGKEAIKKAIKRLKTSNENFKKKILKSVK